MAKKHPEIVATIQDDFTVKVHIPRLLKAVLAGIGAGEDIRIDIAKWYKKRTKQQNAYLWSLVYPTILKYILEKTGQTFSLDDLHDRYKKKFLGYEVCKIVPGLVKTKSSTETSTVEFSDEFVELICIEWADNGLYIPPPDPKWKDKK